jgi:hypothetical protein
MQAPLFEHEMPFNDGFCNPVDGSDSTVQPAGLDDAVAAVVPNINPAPAVTARISTSVTSTTRRLVPPVEPPTA